MRIRNTLFLFIALLLRFGVVYAQAPSIQLHSITDTTVKNPTFVTNANDGTGRMFILEQGGRILVVAPGSRTATVFLDLTDKVLTSTERGLLGLAFHPDFADDNRFFVDYTRKPDGAVVIAEYSASASNPNVAERSESVILQIPHPDPEHNGGMLAFGPDGFLYISVGDGGPGNDPQNRAQDVTSLLGKILRIDIDNPESAAVPYSSPSSNPFYGTQAGRDEIYAYGFRNPWRFTFDPATDEIYVGDVGQDAVEEVDLVQSGGNYGWRVYEAWLCTKLGPAPCVSENYITPIYSYVHTGKGGRCSITGGYVYRGNNDTLPFGAYVFADYCTGEIMMLYHGEASVLLDTAKQITAFGVDEDGEIYVVGGTVDRISNAAPPSTPSTPFNVTAGGGVSFDTAGTEDSITIDHAQIQPDDDDSKPAGLAFIEERNNGILVSESALAATPLIHTGRFYAEVGNGINTGVAIANPNLTETASITFSLTDSAGTDIAEEVLRLPPGGQTAAFLDQEPFNAPEDFNGTVTFTSSIPLAVVALRGIINEQSSFLTTTLPVVETDSTGTDPVVMPHFAAGGAWKTDIFLLNVTDAAVAGRIEFLSPDGQSQNVTADGTNTSMLSYAIAPRSSRKVQISGGGNVAVGSFIVRPDPEQAAPSVATVYAYAVDGVTVSATGSGATAINTKFYIYSEVAGALGAKGSVQTGVAVANPSDTDMDVGFELDDLKGSPTDIGGSFHIPSHGQKVFFIRELPGAAGLATPFQGILQLSAETPISALAIRGRYNERGDFLLSTTPPADPDRATSDAVFIPHVVQGGGYTTRIVIYDLDDDTPVSGNIYFFDQGGRPIKASLK